MLALALLVNSDSTSITALQTQVSTISGTLTLLNTHYNNLNTQYNNLTKALEDQQVQLQVIKTEIMLLNSLIDKIPRNDLTFNFTDTEADETNHVKDLRQFFIDHPYQGARWVYINFHTEGMATTEMCIPDYNDFFRYFSIMNDHFYLYSYNNVYGAMRFDKQYIRNYITFGSRSNNDSFSGLLHVWPTTSGYKSYSIGLTNYGGESIYYDSFHRKTYYTINYKRNTFITFSIGKTRYETCPF